MQPTVAHARPPRRTLHAALTLGALAFILNRLLGSTKIRRERRQQAQALQTWEGEGGAATPTEDVARL